jgi:endoglucanase
VVVGSGTRIQPFIDWLREHGKKGLITEWGVTGAPDYMAVGQVHLDLMAANRDAIIGDAYWAGGPWWGTYAFSCEPTDLGKATQADKPQMALLTQHVQ